ncbi:entry exclusion protein TrbK [Rhizobium leguminosarum bv. viciae]|uniref:Ti type entry exclusion protein TrbK n=1 Tax=Rhizobium esperanzae TaxID=1967781 RepID=A0A7W6XZD0_9HYPH|nr:MULTISPECIES: entry exclusion protein TrbK [Rhizobium]ASS60344.1 entry exclusion protein TrbK [Rhizobium leguminosarum bv. viciae]MBB4343115.1 Ti type entry exclusion protein TrbK [Rhizobium leguminosarum]MBB4443512.1 Ti type entry exclusion protein TrbK [Rhizobium esperanzae]MBB5260975.1 Ti type entry exclusion protein TrbK [Rhizobium leguminosarum]MBB6296193.1 Ti type entry exclusion protein TrbK [Rhizobium leguminosarum]
MSRPVLIALLLAVAAASSAAIVLIVNSRNTGIPALTEEQRAVREKFFGSDKELPPIEEGQEMSPRW